GRERAGGGGGGWGDVWCSGWGGSEWGRGGGGGPSRRCRCRASSAATKDRADLSRSWSGRGHHRKDVTSSVAEHGRQAVAHRVLAPRAGLEPATLRLTAGCSTIELSGNAARDPPD